MVKTSPFNEGDTGDMGSIPGLRRSSGGGNGNPLQYSCLKNLMGREAGQATVHRVTKSWARCSNPARTHTPVFYWWCAAAAATAR